MGRDRGLKCRQCRREEEKLFLKGDRCYTPKCSIEKRAKPPGEQPQRWRSRKSPYSIRLREKQKLRRIYGIREKQFRNYVLSAKQGKGVTGDALLSILERRLDSVLYRSGFAASRTQARQLVSHGHFEINGRRMDIPSYLVKESDTISVKESRLSRVKEIAEANKERTTPRWIEKDDASLKIQVVGRPGTEDVDYTIAVDQIIKFYSR